MVLIPYGNTHLELDCQGAAVLASRVGELRAEGSGADIVRRAMAAPIDSPRLSTLARGRRSCCVIVSDHTRPVPSRDILPPMLEELREGNPDIEITLLVATGFHRPTAPEELEAKLGRELLEQVTVRVHDCRDAGSNVRIGVLPSGAPCVIDAAAAEAELLVAEGFIEPHFFAGFSGGRKSVLPGVCDQVTVLGNHCSRFIDSPFARTGVLDGNPLHADMLAAARMARLAYIVNVVIDEDKRTVAAFAGNFETAHRAGCDFLASYCQVTPAPWSNVLANPHFGITSNGGAPLDQNIYQCVKSMTAAEATCRPGGTVIVCARCADGHGGESFYRSLRDCASPAELYARFMATPQEATIPDQWESQILARILMEHRVILVTGPELRQVTEDMKMTFAPSLPDALDRARAWGGKSVAVIPNGVSVIVK